jgi:hypothetical protein
VTQKLEMIADAVEFIRNKVDTLSGKMGIVSSLLSGFVEKFVVGKLSNELEKKKKKK